VLNECDADVLFSKEHWLSDNQLQLLGRLKENFEYVGICAFENRDILNGRPYGGCAILWRTDLMCNVIPLTTNSNRIGAVSMEKNNNLSKILLANAYMPYESDDESTAVFTEQLCIIQNLIDNNADCHVIVGGDFNVDFTRTKLHTIILNDWCDHMELNPIIRHCRSTIDFSYHFNMDRFNVLDHFLLSTAMFDTTVNNAYAIHDVDNISDHEPIAMKLN
jgi:exonuclease III